MTDFTLYRYQQILSAIADKKLKVFSVRKFIEEKPTDNFAILRHDVEYIINKTYAIAMIEHRNNICATYYFHGPHKKVFNIPIMKDLQSMGHEIGYHYETLDRANGNYKKAINLFERDLKIFRDKKLNVYTVCAHGNPRKKKNGYNDNLDIFEKDTDLLRRNQLIGEAYLTIDFNKLIYVSDVGIKWKNYKNTKEIQKCILNGSLSKFYLLTHPDYWSKSIFEALAWQFAARFIKKTKMNKAVADFRNFINSKMV